MHGTHEFNEWIMADTYPNMKPDPTCTISSARTSVSDLVIFPVTSPSMNHTGIYTALRSLGCNGSVLKFGRYFAMRDPMRPLPMLAKDAQGATCLIASSLERANGRAGFHMQRISVPDPKRVERP